MNPRLLEDEGEGQRSSEEVQQCSFAIAKRLRSCDCGLTASSGEELINLDGRPSEEQ